MSADQVCLVCCAKSAKFIETVGWLGRWMLSLFMLSVEEELWQPGVSFSSSSAAKF